jgi:hypothetical protein
MTCSRTCLRWCQRIPPLQPPPPSQGRRAKKKLDTAARKANQATDLLAATGGSKAYSTTSGPSRVDTVPAHRPSSRGLASINALYATTGSSLPQHAERRSAIDFGSRTFWPGVLSVPDDMMWLGNFPATMSGCPIFRSRVSIGWWRNIQSGFGV